MVVIVGLGNPGSEYEGTRHNIGFEIIERLASALGLRLRADSVQRGAAGRKNGTDVVLSQPRTWMNNSGEAVRYLAARHGAVAGDLIICCDDLHLPLGSLRLRKQGGDGGHNGLRSVIHELGTEEFPRLRCGIRGETAPPPGEPTAEYVLSPFGRHERTLASEMADRAAGALLETVRLGIDRAMNAANTK